MLSVARLQTLPAARSLAAARAGARRGNGRRAAAGLKIQQESKLECPFQRAFNGLGGHICLLCNPSLWQ